MNKLLTNQLSDNSINEASLPPNVKKLLDSIDKSYSEFEEQIEELKGQSLDDLNAQNVELRQESAHQYLIINNLKAAIASLEPDVQEILGDQWHIDTSSSDISYLTDSLLQLIKSIREANTKLKDRAAELEKLNVLLNIEKNDLANERAKDKAVLLAIGDGLVVSQMDGTIQMVNNSFEQILRIPKSEAIGKKMENLVKLENKFGQIIENDFQIRRLAIKRGEKYSTSVDNTYYYIRPDNTKFPVRITATPIKVNQEIIGSVEVFQDITQEEELNKAKTEFVSIASHQLRTPLSSVNWYTELLLDEKSIKENEDYSMYLTEIMKAKDRMTDIINALLDVSRIDLGTFKVAPEKVEADSIVRTILNDLKHKILKKELHISFNFLPTLGPLNVDPRLLTIIFQNLITNAVKYTKEKGIVEITVTTPQNSPSQVYFSVRDNGYGIPEEEQKQIFSKMFRAGNIRKVDTDGNGLGLYIVKSILEVIGGRIWFESKLNEGSKFNCTFPTTWQKRN